MIAKRFSRLKQYMAYTFVLCTFVLTAILPATYYVQTQGVCLKAGRVLSEEDLRKMVLINVVNNEVKNAFQYNWKGGHDRLWIGINSPARETDLRKIIDTSYNNGKSIEENFGIKILLEGRNNGKYKILLADQLSEPFILVSYEPRANGSAMFFISKSVQKISYTDLKSEHKEAANTEIGFLKKLFGYGNHYFRFSPPSFITFGRECCDNRDQDDENYLEKKQEVYTRAISSIVEYAKIRDSSPSIATVSNCGNIWMTKDNNIHWLGNQFEDEDWP
ncbi:MAG: hypothetical protein LBP58_07870 [Azoarcus sp.]|nr:hypothetical protein [Azoarcus sp.]